MQLPSIANESKTMASYAKSDSILPFYAISWLCVGFFLTVIVLITFFPYVEELVETTNKKKPKAYFQFWAIQCVSLGLGIWTVVHNSHVLSSYLMYAWLYTVCFAVTLLAIIVILTALADLNTPTQCCCSCIDFFQSAVTFLAILITTFFSFILIFSIPPIILIYYIHPIPTLARLPFVINSILYINTLTALLVYQLERLFFFCTPDRMADGGGLCTRKHLDVSVHEERFKNHKEYYHKYYKEKKCAGLKAIMEPIVTIMLMIILMTFIVILSDLLNMDRTKFSETSQVELLFTLVPTLLLLVGSIYKRDFFFKDLEKKASSIGAAESDSMEKANNNGHTKDSAKSAQLSKSDNSAAD